MGLDTISAGNAVGFAYELYEKGLLKKSDTDGLELVYGNPEPMIALIKKIRKARTDKVVKVAVGKNSSKRKQSN